MAVIKVACPKCGQKVSGDESFYDKYVNCPICTSKIMFPANPSIPRDQSPPPSIAHRPSSDPFPTNRDRLHRNMEAIPFRTQTGSPPPQHAVPASRSLSDAAPLAGLRNRVPSTRHRPQASQSRSSGSELPGDATAARNAGNSVSEERTFPRP